MAVELYIEDKQVDLTGSEEIAIDYEIFSPESMDSRKSTKSYSFNLRKTANNRAIFENPDYVTSLSQIPYSKLKARLYVDGIDVGIKFAKLTASKTEYSVNLYGGSADFFEAIRTAKLRDFLFCDLNHRWTLFNVIASQVNTAGYIYPIIDYHLDSPNSYINNTDRELFCYHLFPALFYDNILERCIAELGYTLVNQNPQPDLVIAYSGNSFTRGTQTEYLKVKAEVTSDKTGLYNLFHQLNFDYDVLTQSCSYWDLTNGIYGAQFNFEDGVTITGTLYYIIENLTASPVNCNLWMGSAGTSTPEINDAITLNPGINTITKQFTLTNLQPDFASLPFYMTIRDPADTSVKVKAGSYVDITGVTINENKTIEFKPYGTLNGYIVPTALFGEVTITELLKAYCQMFGLIITVDEGSKTATLSKFDEIRANNDYYDWSEKVDFTEEPEVTFANEKFGRVNKFVYADESDEDKPTNADGEILINDEGLNNEETIIELMFSATNSVGRLIDIQTNQIGVLQDGRFSNVKNIRVLRLSRMDTADFTDTAGLEIKDGTSTTTVTLDIPFTNFIGGANGIGFGDRLLTDNYVAIAEIMDSYKKVNVLVRLNASDINQLDFTKPVYIKHFNAYFYINKISEYNPGSAEATMVELVKLF